LYVERFFNSKIKFVQSDWSGEYLSLHKFFKQQGISHRISCSHTHQPNGVIELKLCHIVETGLSLLSHASAPLKFWEDAFVTACYLINHMPTTTLRKKSHFEVLFKTPPDYKFFKVFDSACWPNLRPYNANKLQPRSAQCVFLGYSLLHKGYKCLHLPMGRVYFSSDIIFQEEVFPFTQAAVQSSSNSFTSTFSQTQFLIPMVNHVNSMPITEVDPALSLTQSQLPPPTAPCFLLGMPPTPAVLSPTHGARLLLSSLYVTICLHLLNP
jgi:hypothetical protein